MSESHSDWSTVCLPCHYNGSMSHKIPLDKVLVENSTYHRGDLKKRLVRQGLLIYECKECGLVEWRGKRLALILDHINGVKNDNRLFNLRLLCPNCNSLTDTFAGRNIKNKVKPWKKYTCLDCGTPKSRYGKRCRSCAHKRSAQGGNCTHGM